MFSQSNKNHINSSYCQPRNLLKLDFTESQFKGLSLLVNHDCLTKLPGIMECFYIDSFLHTMLKLTPMPLFMLNFDL